MSTNNVEQLTPKRIAIYVIYDKDGILDDYRKYYLKELRKITDYIVCVVSGYITPDSRKELSKLADEIFVRENRGLLAGSWIDGINHIGWDKLYEYDELLMLNDSFFGPFYPLQNMFDACEKSDADFYGAIRNFEQKSITELAGRALKHGHFMGSICYFYIIRSRLLHSFEFKKYWSHIPEVTCDWDTYFYAEIDFFQYVTDCGFKIGAYQSDKFKEYTFDNLTQNMLKLVKEDKIPFARIRPFCTDIQENTSLISYGKDPRNLIEYLRNNTDYDTEYIWRYILRTKNLTDIYNQLQLEYVVSKNVVEKKSTFSGKIAAIVHIYYEDQIELIVSYCRNFPKETDFYITTTDEHKKEIIEKLFKDNGLKFICKVRPNVGVAMSTLWITYSYVILEKNYNYICYFHDKKSPYSVYASQGYEFAIRCYENLFGTKEIVNNIINLFEDNPRLGILGAPMVYHGNYFMVDSRSLYGNFENLKKLISELGLKVDLNFNKVPVAPYGDMFWFRPKALRKGIAHGFKYDDFDIKYESDFTILHAIERCYGYIAQDAGFYYAEVINSDDARSDLVNYRYMVEQLGLVALREKLYFDNFDELKWNFYKVLRNNCNQFFKTKFRTKAKHFLYSWIDSNNKTKRKIGILLRRLYGKIFKRQNNS